MPFWKSYKTHYKCRSCNPWGWIRQQDCPTNGNGAPLCPRCGRKVATKAQAWRQQS